MLGQQVNTEIVAIQRVITSAGEAQLKGLINQHAAKTGSKKAAALLADWANAKAKFWQIVPPGECTGCSFLLRPRYSWGGSRGALGNAVLGLQG